MPFGGNVVVHGQPRHEDGKMLKGFRLYISRGKLYLALLEYGESQVTYEDIASEIQKSGVEIFNSEGIQQALREGVCTALEAAILPPSRLPGSCWVTVDPYEGAARVNLYPPAGMSRPTMESEVIGEIKKAGCGEYLILSDVIRRNLDSMKKSGMPLVFKAAERKDAEVNIEISEDRKTAHMSFSRAWGGKTLTLQEAVAKINAAGVRFGIDESRVQTVLSNNRDAIKQRVASAQEPVNGTDAKIEYMFDAYHTNVGPRISDDDFADYRDLGLFENVEINAPLARKTPATPGQEGTDVAGKSIRTAAGRDVPLPKGKNTGASPDDPNLLIATSAGAPKLVHGKVAVEEIMIVGDVDFSTGNIDFKGNVLVKGIVNSGFSIIATGDITCKDTVEGADLKAGGNIFLKRGIKGMGKSVIEAGRNIYARFIERSTVIAGGSVIVDEALIHSETSAIDTIEATHTKGSIFGGSARAGNLVRASFLGSEMAVKTEIEVGVVPHLRTRLTSLVEEIAKKKHDHEMASRNVGALDAMRAKGGLTERREQLYEVLTTITSQLSDEIEEISTNIAMLEQSLSQCAEGRIEAKKMIYPGVLLSIKDAKKSIRESIQKAIFFRDGPDVVLSTEIPDQN